MHSLPLLLSHPPMTLMCSGSTISLLSICHESWHWEGPRILKASVVSLDTENVVWTLDSIDSVATCHPWWLKNLLCCKGIKTSLGTDCGVWLLCQCYVSWQSFGSIKTSRYGGSKWTEIFIKLHLSISSHHLNSTYYLPCVTFLSLIFQFPMKTVDFSI